MRNITREEIKEYLREVLTKDRAIVIAVKGKWGIGKTFFIKELLKELKGKYVYVSLFGKSNVKEVIQEMILQLYSWNKAIFKIKEFLGLTDIAVSGETESKSISLSLTTSTIASLLSILEKKDFKEVIIAIDDLERTKIDIDQILGLINQLKEEKNSKIILILNEDQVDDESYKKYKEKCIDIEILFDPTFNENFFLLKKLIKKDEKDGKEEFILKIIKDYFEEIEKLGYKEKNLRILSYIFFKLKEVNFIQEIDLESYLKESIFKTLAYLFYIKKRPTLAISSLKELKDFLSIQKTETIQELAREISGITKEKDTKKENKRFTDFKKLQPQDNILHLENEEFFCRLLEFWESEILTRKLQTSIIESLKSYQSEIQSIRNLKEKAGFIENVYRNYILNLNYTEEDFIKDTWKFLEENKEFLLKITDIWNIIFLIEKLIHFDPSNKDKYLDFAEELFISYINNRIKLNKEFLFEPDSEIHLVIKRLTEMGISNDTLNEYYIIYKNEYINHFQALGCEDLFRYIKQIIHASGWNFSDLEIVNSISKEKLKSCLYETGDLSLIIDFFKYRSKSTDFEDLKKILIEILDELKKESAYKRKIEELESIFKIKIC